MLDHLPSLETDVKDVNSTNEQLANEAVKLRQRIAELELLVAERKSAERAIQEVSRYAESVVNTVREPLVVLDGDLRVISANRSFYQTFTLRAEETQGQLIYDLDNRQWDIPSLRELLQEILLLNTTFDDFEVEHELPRLGRRVMMLSARELYTATSEKRLILLAIQDVTERKRLEAQLLQSQKLETVGRLAGGVAHEFNNLLATIIMQAELGMMRLQSADPSRRNFQQIMQSAERGARFVSQLLAFSRRQTIEPKVIDLNDVLLNMDKMLRRLVGEGIKVVLLLADDLGRVKVDPGQVGQVIVNLVLNARDAMCKSGELTIETANANLDYDYASRHLTVTQGEFVMLAVTDTGLGMTQEIKAHIFEPFFTTKPVRKGTGLGLANCYGIVKQSGGDIFVESEPGVGTTFKIYFPKVDEEAEALPVPGKSRYIPQGTETILLAEDERSLRNVTAGMLRELGYTVLEAANGKEALRVARKHAGEEIHLLLTDIVMPQMNGKILADQLKTDRPKIRMLFMSGYSDEVIANHGVCDPSIAFLKKPFSSAVLARKVREVLDK